MIVLCILAVIWLSIRAAATWRMCVRMADRENARLEAQRLGAPQDAVRPTRPRRVDGPQDAVYAPQDTVPSERCDGLALSRAVVLAMSQRAVKVLGEAGRGFASVRPVRESGSAAATEESSGPTRQSFFAVPRPDGGPAYLGGREDLAYLRGWDDAVDWISDAHDAAPPTWGGVAYMIGWDDAVRAVGQARLSA